MREFAVILDELSAKRFPKKSPEEAKAAMRELVTGKAPGTAGTTVRDP